VAAVTAVVLDESKPGSGWRNWLRPQDAAWVLLFAALAAVSPQRSAPEIEMLAALAALRVAGGRAAWFATRRGARTLAGLELLLGFLLIGVTGGLASAYYPILLLPVVGAATTMGGRGAAAVTALACLAILVFIPWAVALGYTLSAQQIAESFLNLIFLPVVGFLTWQLADANRKLAQRSQQAAEQLGEANRNLQEAEAAVRRSERLAALGQLAAGLAHELRNPMGTMKASAELLGRQLSAPGGPNPEIAGELAGFIATEVDRANSLITRFLDFARPLQLRRQPLDLNELVDRAVLRCEREKPASAGRIHKNPAANLKAVSMDAELLERALLNLLVNALEASPPGATVTVKTVALGDAAEIAVIDRGSGIRPADLEQVFNPFFTTKPEGVGLGLAIVAKIVDEHGGRIEVSSEEGRGSIFRVVLPWDVVSASGKIS
jgi:signal transduction histidine kinase